MVVIYGRNVYNTGGVIPPSSGNIVTVNIDYSAVTSPTVAFANMKYNKKSSLMMVKDDGGIADYTVGYAYLYGGIPATDGQTYAGVYYTDGAGKPIPYKLTSAVNTNTDVLNPAFGQNTWTNRKLMLDTAGWELANHSYDHGYFDRYRDIKLAEQKIYDNTGFRTRAFVVPTNDEGYSTSALSLGYSIVGTAGAFDDFQDQKFTSDGKGIYWGGVLNTRTFNYRQLLFNRWYAGEGRPGDLDDIYTLVDNVFAGSKVAGGSNVGHWFHHGIEDGDGNGSFTRWKDLIQYVYNHPDNNDTMWIAGMQEFTEYYEVKDLVKKTETRTGNTLTITLDLSDIPNENRLRDMSLLVGGGTISNVTVDGADNFSFNAQTGLINIYKKNPTVKDPNTDTAPPRIIGVTKSGNTVNVTFDRSVTQTVFSTSNGQAYTVSGNTVLSVTGSGTNWSVNCQNVVANGATLNYRMQRGNATGTDGMKVCSYIGYSIQ